MNFTIVHIAVAFTIGYILGALGMWLVQKTRRESEFLPEASTASENHSAKNPFEGLDDDRTRIQTRPNLVIAKAPEPANFDKLDTYGQDTQGSIELVEPLPDEPDQEESEDTEDFDDCSLPGIDLPLEDPPFITGDSLDDALGLDDTMSFMRPRKPIQDV